MDTRRYKALEMSLKLKKTWYQAVMMVSKSRTLHSAVGFRKFQVVYIDVAGCCRIPLPPSGFYSEESMALLCIAYIIKHT